MFETTTNTNPRDKINNVIALLREMSRSTEAVERRDHAARYNNFVELSKLVALQKVHGSIDAMVERHCNAVTLAIANDSSRYCMMHNLKQIDDLEKFIAWLSDNDAKIDDDLAEERAIAQMRRDKVAA